uniref:Cytochrome c-type biogenesis protein CcmH/NrfG n=1 Tax=Candidatus Kentrum sp. MB TaxID=2138164 RepID=A0A451BCH6_9GAMM|nr:MAG: Cytochrome c-type biogenesis protein CcmH/NrfG [Candidatus Kentron sp. MB]VFK75968.1 MAG: Cytochrome c-type biogenesis protein CcmH/NrfG [Candidatus Kentron sp. MB]
MRLPSLSFIFTLVILGAACTGPSSVPQKDEIMPTDNAPHADKPTSPSPSKRSFSKQILYDLLVAEFARQRNQLPLAASGYLNVATASREAVVAEQATRLALLAKDQQRAEKAARLWMELDPDAVDAKRIYAALLIYAGNLQESVPILSALLENPRLPPKRKFLSVGELLGQAKDKKAALAVMERIMAKYDTDPNAQFALARFLTQTGKKERAARLLERVIAIDEKNPQAWLYYAKLLHDQGKTAQAIRTFSNALAKGVEDKNIRVGLVQLLISEERHQEARKQFRELIAIDPEDAEVRYVLALFLMQTEHLEEAQGHLRHLIDQEKFVHEAYFGLGQIAESREDPGAAMEFYRKVDGGKHHLDARLRIANLLAQQKKTQEARRYLHDSTPETPAESVRLYRMEGLILTDAGELEEAMSTYDAALRKHSKNSELLYERAMLAGRMNRLSILEHDLKDLLSREPNHAEALNALGYTLADQTDRYQEAMGLIRRALALSPNSYYVLDSMGWVLYRLGQHQQAIDYLQRALAIQQDAEVAAHLGEVLWVTGNRRAAWDVWNKARKEAPDDKRLLDVIKRFAPTGAENEK